MLVAAASWGAATLMNVDVGREFAFVLALQGIAMSTLGWRAYWRHFPVLALMFLTVPSGDLLQPALRALTVEAIRLFATAAQLPHSVDGFVVFIGDHRYIVVDECSGLAYVTLATFLGYSFGLLLYRSLSKVVALALFGAFLGIACNAMRVNAIVLIDWLRDSQMELTAHGNIQWIALFTVLGLLFYVLSRLNPDAMPVAAPVAVPARPSAPRRFGPVVAGVCMLVAVGSGSALTMHGSRPAREQLVALPSDISGWKADDPKALRAIDQPGRTESVTLTYHRDGRKLRVVIIDALSPDAKLPESSVAPRDAYVWREKRIENEVGCLASSCIEVRHTTWQRDRGRQLQHAYYVYSIGEFMTSSRLALRAAHGWHRLFGGRENPRLIGVVSDAHIIDGDELAVVFRALRSTP
jgi:exosortase